MHTHLNTEWAHTLLYVWSLGSVHILYYSLLSFLDFHDPSPSPPLLPLLLLALPTYLFPCSPTPPLPLLPLPLLLMPSLSCPCPHLTLHQIKLIMRQYAEAVSEMNRLCFLQVVATTTQCTPDVLSLMEAYAKSGQTVYHTLASCAIESAVVRRTKIVSRYNVSLYVHTCAIV